VVHPVRPAKWGVSLRQHRRCLFNALLYKKYPSLYRRKIEPSPPWRYYGTLLILGVVLAGFLTQQAGIAAGAASAWAVMTLRFCGRRLQGNSRRLGHVLEMAVTSALIPPLAVFWRLAGAVKYRVLFL
jgi:hypothetical protein